MNIASAELLQNSLQNLGNTFQRNRQMDVENAYRQAKLESDNRRIGVEQTFRDAMMQHYANMEGKQQEANDRAAQSESDRFGLMKAAQQFSEAQQEVPFALKNLRDKTADLAQAVDDGDITPEEATAQFKDAIDNGIGKDNPQLHSQLLQVPALQSIYSGQADWGDVLDKIQAQNAAEAQAAKAAGQKPIPPTEVTTTEHHEEEPPTPGKPAVSHLFKPNEPAVPGTPGSPAYDVTTRSYLPPASAFSASGVNNQVQSATTPAPAAGTAPAASEGQTATNSKTGQKVVYKGGQWQPVTSSAPSAVPGSQPYQPLTFPDGQQYFDPQAGLDRYKFLRNKLSTLGADHVTPDEADEMTSLEKSLGLKFNDPVPNQLPQQPQVVPKLGSAMLIPQPWSTPPNYPDPYSEE